MSLFSFFGCSQQPTEYHNADLGIYFRFPEGWKKIKPRRHHQLFTESLALIADPSSETTLHVSTLRHLDKFAEGLRIKGEKTEMDPAFSSLDPLAALFFTYREGLNLAIYENYRKTINAQAEFSGIKGAEVMEDYKEDGRDVKIRHFIPNKDTPYKFLWLLVETRGSAANLSSGDIRRIEESWKWGATERER